MCKNVSVKLRYYMRDKLAKFCTDEGTTNCYLHVPQILHNQNIATCRYITVVSRIYAPRFATLTAVESVGGAYMRDLTFYLANTPPLPVPRLDVNIAIGTLEAADLPSLLVQKLDGQDRLTEVGHSVDSGVFQAFRGFVLSQCCC